MTRHLRLVTAAETAAAADDVMPEHVLLGLTAGEELAVAQARAHMARLAARAPAAAADLAADLNAQAMVLIRAGHPNPARLAVHLLYACAPAGPRWDRPR